MQEFDSLGARQLPKEHEEEPVKEVWGGKELPLDSMVYKDVQTEDLIDLEDIWKYMAEQVEPEELVEYIRQSTRTGIANRMDLFCHLDIIELPLHEEVIK